MMTNILEFMGYFILYCKKIFWPFYADQIKITGEHQNGTAATVIQNAPGQSSKGYSGLTD